MTPAFQYISIKCHKIKKGSVVNTSRSSGERGIRTPGGVTLNGFQDRRIRPLCHFSAAKVAFFLYSQTNFILFFD